MTGLTKPLVPSKRIVVMGVSGCGKTSLGQLLAQALNIPFIDGDDLHPARNIALMAQGQPLTDADRWPWLDRVAQVLSGADGVVACSALKRSYRDRIKARAGGSLVFMHLAAPKSVIAARLAQRAGHFMPAALLDSQYVILEPLSDDENGTTLPADHSLSDLLATALRG